MNSQQIIDQFKKEIFRFTPLKNNEEAKKYIDTILYSKHLSSRLKAKKRLINRTMPIVFNKAMKVFRGFYSVPELNEYQFSFVLDLIQEANIKMLRLLEQKKYLLTARNYFLSYLRTSVKWILVKYSIEQKNPMKIPISKYLQEEEHLKFVSLDAPVSDENDTPLKDFIADPQIDIVKQTEKMLLLEQVNNFLTQKNFLNPMERIVLEMEFGFWDGISKNREKIKMLSHHRRTKVEEARETGIEKIRERMGV